MHTRALVLYEADQPLQVEELELLPPRDGEVLVRFVASGLCHTDLHTMQGKFSWPMPAVLGHEGAGVVEAIGAGVTTVQVGDHVITSYRPSCGRCWYCTQGRPNLCELRDQPAHLMHDGTTRFRLGDREINHYFQTSTFAELSVLPQDSVIAIRKDAPLDVVCLVSCGVATGAFAVINRAQVKPGSTVAIFGCGGVGLSAVQAAALSGAARIVAVDVFRTKLDAALEFGATHVVDATTEDPVERIKAICGRGGADYSVELVGTIKTMEQALQSVHRGGTTVVVGVAPQQQVMQVDPWLLLQERILTGASFGSVRQRVDLPLLIDLFMDGKFKLREMISRHVALDEVNEAYDALQRGEIRRSVLLYG